MSEIVKNGVKIICGCVLFPGVDVNIDLIKHMLISFVDKFASL
jgi:hypothetical protein